MRLVLWLNNVSCCTGRSFPAVTFLVIVAIVSAPARPAYCYPSPRYTESWAVEVRGGREAADKLAKDHGFTNLGEVGNLKDMYHFTLNPHGNLWGDPGTGQRHTRSFESFQSHGDRLRTMALQREANVGYVRQQELAEIQKKGVYQSPQDPLWPYQWSLENTGQVYGAVGLDLNVEGVWMQGGSGRGVVVVIVDDGIEINHPDLEPNFDSRASRDFVDHDYDPSPADPADDHGTACAGVVGMARNGICGVGVAPETSLGGLRMDMQRSIDISQAAILSYQDNYVDVYSCSWGPPETGFTVGGPEYLTLETFKRESKQGREGKGSIYVWAAGNGGKYHDSCAADGYVNSIYTIAVGSADQDGHPADYDEPCSAKMAVTFSHNSNPTAEWNHEKKASKQLYTTSLNGECTDSFTGTSASAPLLAGVVSLVLEANPDLTWRDVQYLIVYTSNPDILTVDDLTTNGAGLKFSHSFGFGAIDAEAMVTRARHWTNVPEQISQTMSHNTIHTIEASSSVVIEFRLDNSRWSYETVKSLEHVVVTLSLEIGDYGREYTIEDFKTYERSIGNDTVSLREWLSDPHPKRGDVQIQLTSPRNTTSILLPYRDFDFINSDGYDQWPFMTVHNWGENPTGTWSLQISYKSSSGYVRVSGVDLTLYGTWSVPDSIQDVPDKCDDTCARGCWGDSSKNCDVCTKLRLDDSQECVNECPSGYTQYKSYCLFINPETTNNTTNNTTTNSHEDNDSDIEKNPLILVCVIVAVLILIGLCIIILLLGLFTCHYCYYNKKQTAFYRLRDDVTSV